MLHASWENTFKCAISDGGIHLCDVLYVLLRQSHHRRVDVVDDLSECVRGDVVDTHRAHGVGRAGFTVIAVKGPAIIVKCSL